MSCSSVTGARVSLEARGAGGTGFKLERIKRHSANGNRALVSATGYAHSDANSKVAQHGTLAYSG